ncbi:MAG: hypothetical protein IJI67_03035 [Clostridia bacterium]|nr:hypothetical protein [Clostridia bacterium]
MQNLAAYKRETARIAAFGGLNHTDLAQPGEWYDMCNLSERCAPLLAPRHSREVLASLTGQAGAVLLKNGIWYYTVPGSGIYCYAPQGDNPFAAEATTAPLLIFQSARDYRLLEMGNRVIAIPTDGSDNAVSVKGGTVKLLGYNEQYHYRNIIYIPAEGAEQPAQQPLCVSSYEPIGKIVGNTPERVATYIGVILGNEQEGVSFYRIPNAAAPAGQSGYYDAFAQSMLNIGFTYACQEDSGSYYYLHAKAQKYAPDTASFGSDRYFLGTDNKFYFYDSAAAAVTEIIAPCIAIMLRLGDSLQQPNSTAAWQKAAPVLEEGDYIRFSAGATTNRRHPLYDSMEQAAPLLEGELLRVRRCTAIPADQTPWGVEGWTHCILVDYNAAFIEKLCKKDLFYCSPAYTALSAAGTAAAVETDLALKQLYPASVSIENAFPVISCPLEHNNRIWAADNGSNEIRASAQGNFEVWDDYRGLSSDSYAVSIGSNDSFTASFALGDYLYFFKEHAYTCVYGTRPANFCTAGCNDFIGIRAADACSLQVIDKNAYYMGIDGRVYRFNGQQAFAVSAPLGEVRYTALASAHTAETYRLLVEEENGQRFLLVYNTVRGTWFKEDAAQIDTLLNLQGRACALSHGSEAAGAVTEIVALDRRLVPAPEHNRVAWWCESGLLGLESDCYRYFARLHITFESEAGATLEVLARFDNESDYTPLATFVSERKGTRTQSVPLRRCAFLRLKLRGTGVSKIYHISYETTQGGEK